MYPNFSPRHNSKKRIRSVESVNSQDFFEEKARKSDFTVKVCTDSYVKVQKNKDDCNIDEREEKCMIIKRRKPYDFDLQSSEDDISQKMEENNLTSFLPWLSFIKHNKNKCIKKTDENLSNKKNYSRSNDSVLFKSSEKIDDGNVDVLAVRKTRFLTFMKSFIHFYTDFLILNITFDK